MLPLKGKGLKLRMRAKEAMAESIATGVFSRETLQVLLDVLAAAKIPAEVRKELKQLRQRIGELTAMKPTTASKSSEKDASVPAELVTAHV